MDAALRSCSCSSPSSLFFSFLARSPFCALGAASASRSSLSSSPSLSCTLSSCRSVVSDALVPPQLSEPPDSPSGGSARPFGFSLRSVSVC